MSITDSPSGPIVRPATKADLPRLGVLGARLVEEHHAYDSRRFIAPSPRTPADYAAFLSTQLAGPDSAVLVVEDRGQVVGYAYTEIEGFDFMALRGPAGVLHDLLVDESCRGRGVGRLLLAAVVAYIRSRGVNRVVLSSAYANTPAQAFFASAGFRPTMVEMNRELDDDPA